MSATLYAPEHHPRAVFIKAVAAFEKVDLKHEVKAPGQLDPKLFPRQKVPGFTKGDFSLTQTNAIAQYITYANDQSVLPGKTQEDKAKVIEWINYAYEDLHDAVKDLAYPRQIPVPVKSSPAELEKHFEFEAKYIESSLANTTFLVGERITFADFAVASVLGLAGATFFDAEAQKKYPNITRFYLTVANQPAYLTAAGGEPKLVEQRLPVIPAGKNQEKKKEAKPAAAAAAAAPAAKKEKKKEVKDDDEEDDATPAEPKAKHPLESLPKAKLVLDEWKRQYSNLDTPEALKWFEANFDPQEYSLWRAVYKYPEDLTQVFMSSNLIGGFHNRLEGSRKYLFGSAGVYGTANNSKIQGVYLVRGGDWKPAFDVAPDFESYDFTPLDISKAEDKQLIHEAWKWEGELDGLKYADGKVFK